jgi:hypothetical protein
LQTFIQKENDKPEFCARRMEPVCRKETLIPGTENKNRLEITFPPAFWY